RHVIEVGIGWGRFDFLVKGRRLRRHPVETVGGRRSGGRGGSVGRWRAGRCRAGRRRSRGGVNSRNRPGGRPRGRWSWPGGRGRRKAAWSGRGRGVLGGCRRRRRWLGGPGRRLWRCGCPGLTLGLLNTFEQRQAVLTPSSFELANWGRCYVVTLTNQTACG
ncbi:MAG: hypothetical protein QOJ33_2311, partial [Chloroflexota bacterium]|nr:hypothetical protein [Chloroflexota bacterium]